MLQFVVGVGIALAVAGGALWGWFGGRDEAPPPAATASEEPEVKSAITRSLNDPSGAEDATAGIEQAFGGMAAAVPQFEPEPLPQLDEDVRPRTAEEWAAQDAANAARMEAAIDGLVAAASRNPEVRRELERVKREAERTREPANVEDAIAGMEAASRGMLGALREGTETD